MLILAIYDPPRERKEKIGGWRHWLLSASRLEPLVHCSLASAPVSHVTIRELCDSASVPRDRGQLVSAAPHHASSLTSWQIAKQIAK
jgi:hypothetical protein